MSQATQLLYEVINEADNTIPGVLLNGSTGEKLRAIGRELHAGEPIDCQRIRQLLAAEHGEHVHPQYAYVGALAHMIIQQIQLCNMRLNAMTDGYKTVHAAIDEVCKAHYTANGVTFYMIDDQGNRYTVEVKVR